ncbi:MAG: DnaJ domain-containing protein [Pseudomonadota bacterium]
MRIDYSGPPLLGKAVGLVAGVALTPESSGALWLISAAIVGAGIGHLFDVFYGGRSRAAAGERDAASRNARQQEFLFAGMGHIAKASGAVMANHIDYVEATIASAGMEAEARKQAIQWFKAGKRSNFDFADLARAAFAGATQHDRRVERAIMGCCVDIGVISMNDEVLARLSRLGNYMGLSKTEVAKMISRGSAAFNGASEPAPATEAEPPMWAYERLNIAPGASAREIKRAYRRLVARFHPDKLDGDASRDEIEQSNTRMREIREAFEALQEV